MADKKAISTYKTYLMSKDASTYTKLLDIKDFPDLGGAPEMIDVTTLSDSMTTYIMGIQSADALEFTANYTKAEFDKLKLIEGQDKEFAVFFGENGEDGKYGFGGQLAVYIVGGSVNAAVDMKISIAPTTPIAAITD